MNLYLLVEGNRTEPKVYSAWMEHALPALQKVDRLSDVQDHNVFIFRGGGYPSYLRRIRNALSDIRDHGSFDHFLVCVDAEEKEHDERLIEVSSALEEAVADTQVLARCPGLGRHVVIQNCCIETWLLGHRKMLRRNPQSTKLVAMKSFYDVSEGCPEHMTAMPGYVTRMSFHLDYLKEMLAEQGRPYSKEHPGIVMDKSYFDALAGRCAETDHLPSLKRLLDVWRALRGA